jgi:hypothetical protein
MLNDFVALREFIGNSDIDHRLYEARFLRPDDVSQSNGALLLEADIAIWTMRNLARHRLSGQAYKSLSEVAHRITGTRWSGRPFFGLIPVFPSTVSLVFHGRHRKGTRVPQ